MKKILLIWILFFLFSCSGNNEENINAISKVDSLKSIENIQSKIDACQKIIVGDKLIFSSTMDEHNLKSPAKIYIVKECNDSLEALNYCRNQQNSLFILNTKNYYFLDKSSPYVVYSKTPIYSKLQPKSIYRIRPNNFAEDSSIIWSKLPIAYQKYKIQKFIDEELFLIYPLKNYGDARMFFRLLKLNPTTQIRNSLTINDFEFKQLCKLDKTYFIGLNDFSTGSSRYFTGKDYSIKMVWINNELKILKSYNLFLMSTQLNKVYTKDGFYIVQFELHTQCDGDEKGFCIYEVKFDKDFKFVDLYIVKYPSRTRKTPESLLQIVKKQFQEALENKVINYHNYIF